MASGCCGRRGIIGKPLPQRVTGSDGVPLIAAEAAKRGWRLYLLGAAPGVADKAAEVLRARHPGHPDRRRLQRQPRA